MCLLISQMKESEEIVQTLDKIKFHIFSELESIIKMHTLNSNNTEQNKEEQSQAEQPSRLVEDFEEYWSDFSDEDY